MAAGAILVLSTGASGSRNAPPASDLFSIFAKGAPTPAEPAIADLPEQVGGRRADLAKLRLLGDNLGRFDSRLVAFPARGGRTICYSLLGKTAEEPGMSYCYQPGNSVMPAKLADEHFSAVALESVRDSQVGVQLFGVAFDDVVSLRVHVGDNWIGVPLANNGFYLDLPGVPHDLVGLVEATLANGTKQVHDIQTGL